MQENDKLQLFEDQPIRTAWDEENEEWYFSIVDVVSVLTESVDYNTGRKYWNKLKQRMLDEGNQLVTNCHQLKMKSPKDGKRYKTDIANTEELLRIIQSIPSKKAEPFKLWLAQVGRERIEEIIDPELTIDRALETYRKKSYPADWINQRLQTIRARKELTDTWKEHGIEKSNEFAILTDEVTKAWSGLSTRQYKNLKGLKKENLRDNMSTLELALNMLAEATTTELTFENIKHVNEFGQEFWYARELQSVLEYSQWRRFKEVVLKAKEACKNSNNLVEEHFADVGKMIVIGNGGEREIEDYDLLSENQKRRFYAQYLQHNIQPDGAEQKNFISDI